MPIESNANKAAVCRRAASQGVSELVASDDEPGCHRLPHDPKHATPRRDTRRPEPVTTLSWATDLVETRSDTTERLDGSQPAMLLSRQEMSFDFGGARFDPNRDRELLVWIFNQFLYGEVTGIQCGHWLYRAPSLDAAHFLARQAMEELTHVDRFLEILALLSGQPAPAHRAVRFLSSGMMGDDWAEHVCLEMALGEGYVLSVLYGLIDTIDHDGIRQILTRATRQEQRHVAFGEAETQRAIRDNPRLARRLSGLALWSLLGVKILARGASGRASLEHPVVSQLPAFLSHVVRTTELRLRRLGILEGPLSELGPVSRGTRMLASGFGHIARRLWPFRQPLLTETYLKDPRVDGPQPRSSARETVEKTRGAL